MATSQAQKKRNRKILGYALLILFTILQSLFFAKDDQ